MEKPQEKSRLYIYSFDNTLVNTKEVLEKNGWLDQTEELCYNDSEIGQKVADQSEPTKVWKQVEGTAKLGDNMILSCRNAMQIAYWLKENDKGSLITVLMGLGTTEDTVEQRKTVLERCTKEEYDEIFYYSCDADMVEAAKSVPGIIPMLVKKD
jgi:hypothetical protein